MIKIKYLFSVIIFTLFINNFYCQKIIFDNYSFVLPKEMKTKYYDAEKIKYLKSINNNTEKEYYDYNSNSDYIIFSYFNSEGNSLITNSDLYALLNQRPALEAETIKSFQTFSTSKPEIIRINDILIFKTEKKEKNYKVVTYYIEEKLDKIVLMFQQSYNKKWDSYRENIIKTLQLLENKSLVNKLGVKLDKNPNPKFSNNYQLGKLNVAFNKEVDFVKTEDSYTMKFKNNRNLLSVISTFKNQNLPNLLNSEYFDEVDKNNIKSVFESVLEKMLSAENNAEYEIRVKPTFTRFNNINGVFAQVYKNLNKDSNVKVLQDYFFIPNKEDSYLILFFNFNPDEIHNEIIDKFYQSFTLE